MLTGQMLGDIYVSLKTPLFVGGMLMKKHLNS